MRKIALIVSIILGVTMAPGCKTIRNLIDPHGTQFKVAVTPRGNDGNIVAQVIKVTQAKLNSAGLSGEVTQDPGDPNQVIVKLYHPENLDRWKAYLFTAYRLELRKVVSPPSPSPVTTFPTEEDALKAVGPDQEVLPYSERDGGKGSFVIVEKSVVVDGRSIRDASTMSVGGDYMINFSLNQEGAQRFGEWTGKNINNYIGVVLDGKIVSAAFIKSQIFDSGQITGRFSKAQAEDIALSLKSGYLPAELHVVSESEF